MPRSRSGSWAGAGQRQREPAGGSLISDSARPLTSCQRRIAVSGPRGDIAARAALRASADARLVRFKRR